MILIGLGSNLSGPTGAPIDILRAALAELSTEKVVISNLSPFYQTSPVPRSDQPDFVNAVATLETDLSPHDLLKTLHQIENEFGRVRVELNGARTLDLDLIDYNGLIVNEGSLILPHPRLQQRAFVLIPLRDVAPDYRHPVTGAGLAEMIDLLPNDQMIRQM